MLDYNVTKPLEGDTSIVTFKGHRIQKSLIRAKFSPASTGQRYIYTGCSTGRLISKKVQSLVQNIILTTFIISLWHLDWKNGEYWRSPWHRSWCSMASKEKRNPHKFCKFHKYFLINHDRSNSWKLFSNHPFQWDYSVNINTFQDKSTEKKRTRGSFMSSDYLDESDSVSPPLRRSRRIAQRLASGASTSRRTERNWV